MRRVNAVRRPGRSLGWGGSGPYSFVADANVGDVWIYSDLANGAVSTWTGRKGNALTQGTGSLQPMKGASGVVFDGSNDRLVSGGSGIDTFIHAQARITVVTVMSDASITVSVPYCYGGAAAGSFYSVANDVGGAGFRENVAQSGGQNYRSFADDLSSAVVRADSYDITYTSGAVYAMRDGSPLSFGAGLTHTTVDSVFGSGLGFCLGAYSNGASLWWAGTIKGIAVCAGNLTGQALNNVCRALANACGVTYAPASIGNSPAILAAGDSLEVGYNGNGNVSDPGPGYTGGWRVPLNTVLAAQSPAINRTQVGPYTTGGNLGSHDGVGGQQGVNVVDLPLQVSTYSPDIIIIGWGVNDALASRTAAQIAAMWAARITDALNRRRSNAAIIVHGMPLVTAGTAPQNAAIVAANALGAAQAAAAGGAANKVYWKDPNDYGALTLGADGIHWADGATGYTAVAGQLAITVTQACNS